MRYFINLLFTLLTSHIGLCCTCEALDSTNVAKWIELADFVVEGEYITNLSPDQETLERYNQEQGGFEVLFRVISTIKGTLSTDTLAIVQFGNGSCLTTFLAGEKYVVMGTLVKRFVCETVLLSQDKDQIPNDVPPPPTYVDGSGTFKIPSCEPDEQSFWNKVSSNYVTLFTDYCTTYNADSEVGRLLLQN